MGKEINISERKLLQLEMLDEVDKFCRMHNIQYSLAFGTLLGAVRHQGFIPWDDDLDIMMPLPDLLRFKSLFKSDTIEYVDIDTYNGFRYPFSRLCSKKSYSKIGKNRRGPGLCLDLYIMCGIPESEQEQVEYFKSISLYRQYRKYLTKLNKYWRKLPVQSNIPGLKYCVKKIRDLYFYKVPFSTAKKWHMIAGPIRLRKKMTYDLNIFNNMTELPFEGKRYQCIESWDYFLKLRYGDYMELPSEDQRHPYHANNYYWI